MRLRTIAFLIMDAELLGNEAETGLVVDGFLKHTLVPAEAAGWLDHSDPPPSFMRNDNGPATVKPRAEDLARDATSRLLEKALERALQKGEEYEYDE